MDAVNPYAPPQAPLSDGAGAAAGAAGEADADLPPWELNGLRLIVRHGVTLPDICLFTGAPTRPADRLRLQLTWTPTWFRIMAVFAPLLLAFAYSAFRRAATVEFGLSPAGRRRRRLFLLLTVGAVASALGMVYRRPGYGHHGPLPFLLLFLSFVVLSLAAFNTRLFRVVEIDRRRRAHLTVQPEVARAFARLPPPHSDARGVSGS